VGDVTRFSRSFGGRLVVVNTVGRSRAWSGKSGTAIVGSVPLCHCVGHQPPGQ